MIGLYFGGRQFKTLFGNFYGSIELDANLEEVHEWSAEATENPVEEGAPVSDHVIEKQDKLRIRGFVSDSPTSDTVVTRITGIYNGKKLDNRTQNVFDALQTLIKAKEPIVVYTKHRIYDDMVLTGVNIPRSPGVGEAIEFTAEFVHIRKVVTQTVEVPNGISKKNNTTSKAKTKPQDKQGNKQSETKEPKSSSVLQRLFK